MPNNWLYVWQTSCISNFMHKENMSFLLKKVNITDKQSPHSKKHQQPKGKRSINTMYILIALYPLCEGRLCGLCLWNKIRFYSSHMCLFVQAPTAILLTEKCAVGQYSSCICVHYIIKNGIMRQPKCFPDCIIKAANAAFILPFIYNTLP